MKNKINFKLVLRSILLVSAIWGGSTLIFSPQAAQAQTCVYPTAACKWVQNIASGGISEGSISCPAGYFLVSCQGDCAHSTGPLTVIRYPFAVTPLVGDGTYNYNAISFCRVYSTQCLRAVDFYEILMYCCPGA